MHLLVDNKMAFVYLIQYTDDCMKWMFYNIVCFPLERSTRFDEG